MIEVSCPVDMKPETPALLPDERALVEEFAAELAAERPDLLEGSCVENGGDNEFLFE